MTPMPPAWAMAMASRASVTVSIAAEMIGRLRLIERVSRVRMSASAGKHRRVAGREQHVVEGERLARRSAFR